VAPSPTFSLYRLLTGVLGGRYLPVPLGEGFAFDVDRIVETAIRERAKVVVLNSPNNPTGSALPDGAVERLLAETGALVLCDEAYQDFGGPSAIPLLSRSSRVVVLRTFSKAMGMAGLRFGLALAHPEVARELAKGKLPYNVNLVTLAAAEVALDHAELLGKRTREIAETRDRFLPRLAALDGIEVFPSAANFVLLRCRARPASEVFRRLHEEHGILVRDVSGSPELAECLRISIGTEEDMAAVLEALSRILAREEP
jgi:histidinol-phosphate aminotransferase